jgi:glycogen synthase
MKVIAITPKYLPFLGGIEVFVDALARRLRHRSIETVVITDDNFGHLPERETLNDIVIHRLAFSGALETHNISKPLAVLHQLVEVLETERPDLVHMHSAVQWSAWYVERLLKKRSMTPPFVVTQHGSLEPIDCLTVVRDLLLRADALTAVSKAALGSAVQFCGRTAYSTVIYNGIEKHDDVVRVDRPGARYGLLCVGRLEHQKGYDVAIAALAKALANGLDADLTLVGYGKDHKYLQQAAIDLDVADRVYFVGTRDHRSALEAIASCSLLLVPSRSREGFSLVAAEAALSGVPCIASRLGGLPEVVEDGVTGVLVEPDNPDALASSIVSLLRDEQLRKTIGANAQRIGREKFDMDRCVEDYLRLYRGLT